MLRRTQTVQRIGMVAAIGAGLGLLLVIASQFMRYTGRGLGEDGAYLTYIGIFLIVATVAAAGGGYWLFRQRWSERQAEINKALADNGVTLAIAPRSATMDDLKDIGLWRRLAVILNRAKDYPERHISWEVVGSRDRVVVLMRIPAEWQRSMVGEIVREFPGADITVFPNDPKKIKGGLLNVHVDPPFEAAQNKRQIIWQGLRLTTDTAYPLFTGETRIDQMIALLSAVNMVNPKAYVGYQFLIRRALPTTRGRWLSVAQKLIPQPKPGQPAPKIPDETRRLSKAMTDRAQEPAFEVEVRCWAASSDPAIAQNELSRIVQALVAETFTSGPYNQLGVSGQPNTDPTPILHRSFPTEAGAELTPTELGSFLHLPGKKGVQPFQKLMTATAKKLPPAVSLIVPESEKSTRRILGHFYHPTGDVDIVGVPFDETRKHALVIGPTGSGKSVGLINMAISDYMLNNAGVMVIEPSGDIPADLVAGLPPEVLNDVVLLNPRDSQPFGMNMCAIGTDLGLAAAVQNAVGAIQMAMGANWGTAVRMQQLVINGLYVIMDVLNRPEESGASMVALGRFLQNAAYREELVERTSLEAAAAKNFWINDFANWNEREQQESVSVAMRRLSVWIGNPQIRRTVGLPFSTINLDVMLGGPLNDPHCPPPKLIMLPLHPRMGQDTKALIGSLLVNYFVSVMLLRDAIPREHRRTAALHIDEFKNFVNTSGGEDVEILLAECRKYGAATSLYTQGQRQLSETILIETDINTLTKIFYGLSDPKEVRIAAGQMAQAVDGYDLMAVPRFHAYVKVGNNPPTLLQMLPPAMDRTPPPSIKKGFVNRPPQTWQALTQESDPFRQYMSGSKPKAIRTPESLSELAAPELLRWAYHLKKSEPDTLVRQLAEMPDDAFAALQKTRRQFDLWRAAEVAANPGLIPDRLQRVARRSRWLYGVPDWESDALYLRMTNQGGSNAAGASDDLSDLEDFGSW